MKNQFNPTRRHVEIALEKLGFNVKNWNDAKREATRLSRAQEAMSFLDDQEKCRAFIGHLQGADAIVRGDKAYMTRYQVRAERIVREYLDAPVPADLDVKKEKYKTPKKEVAVPPVMNKDKMKYNKRGAGPTVAINEGYKGHRIGSRREQARQVFDKQGKEGLDENGNTCLENIMALGVQRNTAHNYISQFSRECYIPQRGNK